MSTLGKKFPKELYPNIGWRKYNQTHNNNIGKNNGNYGVIKSKLLHDDGCTVCKRVREERDKNEN